MKAKIAVFDDGGKTIDRYTGTFKAPRYIGAEDGRLWKQEQAALLNLKPLTLKDVERVQKYAAY